MALPAEVRLPTRSDAPSVIVLLGVIAAGLACATATPPARSSLPVVQESDSDAAQGFEPLPLLRAEDVVAPALRRGPHHRVLDEVRSDGFMRIYRIDSDFGEFEAYGDAMLETRVAEVLALANLGELSAGAEFARALRQTLESPFVAAWNLVSSPVESIRGIPLGALETLRDTAALTRGERGELEDSALAEFLGFEERKRDVAFRLGVDPYSSNRPLQRALNRFAWVSFVGGLPSRFVPFRKLPGAEGEPDFAPERAEEFLRDFSPEDLRRLNRIELAVMGVPEATAQAFIAHPWYSPRQQSLLIAHLAVLDLVGNRAVFIETASRAESELDALLYARTAALIRTYHDNVQSLERLAPLRNQVVGVTPDGRMIAALALDYAVWTRPARDFADSFEGALLDDGSAVAGRELLLTGSLSPTARDQIRDRGIRVTEHALEIPAVRRDPAADEG
jgi:hypothetical protein